MEYRTAILDELGYLVAWCSEITDDEKVIILEEHPEYYISTVLTGGDGYEM